MTVISEEGLDHAARTSSLRRDRCRSSLRSLSEALASGFVDPLEEGTARVVEREEVDEADVLEHLGCAVPREQVLVRQVSREVTAPRRSPCRAARPSPLCAPTSADRRAVARWTAPPRRRRRARRLARHGRGRTTHCRRAARTARPRPPSRAASRGSRRRRRARSGPSPSVSSISVASAEVGIRSEQRGAPEANDRIATA